MRSALVGYTGFVGSNLARQHPFDDLYNSSNIESIAGRSYDLLVCAAARADKWRINRDPQADRDDLARLTAALARVGIREAILISTVDVYPSPAGVDEESPIDPERCQPYGRHRFELETFMRVRFDAVVARLPGLFGPGLKKNVIYDFLHDNNLAVIDADASFQFYDLGWLWPDIERFRRHGLRLVNCASEPVSVREVAHEGFGFDFNNRTAAPRASYDFRTRHDRLLGGSRGYLYTRSQVLNAMRAFVDGERQRA